MAFTLRNRRNWLFLPVILLELGMDRLLQYFNIHPLWEALILILIALFLTALVLKGKIIFYPSFYRSHKTVEIHEIEVPEKIAEKILGKPKVKGKTLNIKNHIVRRKIRKKRFEL